MQHMYEGSVEQMSHLQRSAGVLPGGTAGEQHVYSTARPELKQSRGPWAAGGWKPPERLIRAIKAYSCPQGPDTQNNYVISYCP